jgi:hypothetical protein
LYYANPNFKEDIKQFSAKQGVKVSILETPSSSQFMYELKKLHEIAPADVGIVAWPIQGQRCYHAKKVDASKGYKEEAKELDKQVKDKFRKKFRQDIVIA